MFYLPCQAGNGGVSFITDYTGPARKPLDANDWAAAAAQRSLPSEPIIAAPVIDAIDLEQADRLKQARIARALDKWRSAPPNEGNRRFFLLGVDLRRAGLDTNEMRQLLRQEASAARSPAERQSEIEHVLANTARR